MNWKLFFLTYATFLGLVFAKHTRLEKIQIPEPKEEVNLSQDGYFSPIHEKSKVVCTLKDRFTDIFSDIQWKRNVYWQ